MHTVLIAEDDMIFLRLLTSALKKYRDKFKIISARNGEDAVEILNQKTISLLVTDIQMPKMNGLELLAYVNEHHPVIPCFVMTAHASQETKELLPTDTIYFFPKPLEPDKLGQAIIQVLERDIPRGALYGITVVRFLRMIEMEQVTCLFEVKLPKKEKGLFYFDNGILYDVVCGSLKGEAAARELITLEKATFRFKYFPDKKIEKRIKIDLSSLIMEAMRREAGYT